MARERFIDSLRLASRALSQPKVSSGHDPQTDAYISMLYSPNLWLTPKSVEGFDPTDFSDWPKNESEQLAQQVGAFLAVAQRFPANAAPTKSETKQGRKHLKRIIQIVRQRLLHEWLDAQNEMIKEAAAAAQTKGWYVEKDHKEILESLLGSYKAPRLRIRAPDQEVVLDPIARFGTGRRGIVDLVAGPTYETMYLVTFKDGHWRIISPRGTLHSRPFTQTTLVNTITSLSRR
jgi:hypothetical protein